MIKKNQENVQNTQHYSCSSKCCILSGASDWPNMYKNMFSVHSFFTGYGSSHSRKEHSPIHQWAIRIVCFLNRFSAISVDKNHKKKKRNPKEKQLKRNWKYREKERGRKQWKRSTMTMVAATNWNIVHSHEVFALVERLTSISLISNFVDGEWFLFCWFFSCLYFMLSA